MLVGIISDTHENMNAIDTAVRIFNDRRMSIVFHAGDIISPITYSHFAKLKCRIHLVFGNNDGEKKFLTEKFSQIGTIQSPPLNYELKDENFTYRFVVFHEPPMNIDEIAKTNQFDYIIYGHTHKKDLRQSGKTIILNPGEAGGWLLGEKSIAIIDTETQKIEFVSL